MRVFVEQLEMVARHGVYDDERREGRYFSIDFSVEIPDSEKDEIGDTLNYCDLCELVKDVMTNEQFKLVETIAKTISDRAFSSWPSVLSSDVCVRKRAYGVPGNPKWVGVSLTRTRSEHVV